MNADEREEKSTPVEIASASGASARGEGPAPWAGSGGRTIRGSSIALPVLLVHHIV
jgi:hypothetical protein